MKKEWADKWVAALRSGKYKQGKDRLRTGDSFCCLGVLCDLVDRGSWTLSPQKSLASHADVFQHGRRDVQYACLPKEVTDTVGMKTRTGTFATSPGESTALDVLNDTGKDFDYIADLIEKDWEKL